MTARFVAEYSIQLSYECMCVMIFSSSSSGVTNALPYSRTPLQMVHSTGFEPVTARFVAEYSIQLSYECIQRCEL